jgi:AcrR family transcriptional regulator
LGKKRRIGQRDSEATRRKLLEATSAIMRESGFSALKIGNIARVIGMDKNLIRYHFSNLAGLQKAYIREKDYWPPFFERFSVGPDSTAFDLEQLFSELMAENLRFFYGDTEMQKIILWQISERNALMRSISDAREADGEQLLGLTDKFFSGTEVNFRAVIALLLGGAYYMVLHANGNGSVVCGIDVHSDRYRADVMRTIGQVVGWAFARVDDGLTGEGSDDASSGVRNVVGDGMFTGLDKLAVGFKYFIAEARADVFYVSALESEVDRVRFILEDRLLGISGATQLGSFIRVCMFRLGSLSDRFYLDGEDGGGECVLVSSLLEVFLNGFREYVPADLVLPKVVWEREFLVLRTEVVRVERLLEILGIDALLGKVVREPLFGFFEGKGVMSFGELDRIKRYLISVVGTLEGVEVTDDELFFGLIALGENGVGLLEYLKERVRSRCEGKSALEIRKALLSERERVSSVLVSGDDSVKALLLGWLDKEMLAAFGDGVLESNTLKFTSGLKVVELALLSKLLYDKGVFGKVKLDVFVQQIAHNFMSAAGGDISTGSVKSKLYPKDVEVISAVERLLVSMLAELRSRR